MEFIPRNNGVMSQNKLIAGTYNVFTGTALGTGFSISEHGWVGHLSGCRLDNQAREVSRLEFDVLGLQEMGPSSVSVYRERLSSTHTLITSDYLNRWGLALLFLWRSATVLFFLTAQGVFMDWYSQHLGQLIRTAVLILVFFPLSVYLSFVFIPVQCTPSVFLEGKVHGGLGLLVNRKKMRVLSYYCRDFVYQSGDLLNFLRKRAYQCALVEVISSDSQNREGPPCLLLLVHTHANLGAERGRREQMQELVTATSRSSLLELLAATSFKNVDPSSVPTIILGDFNTQFSSPSVSSTLGEAGFVDAWGMVASQGERQFTWDNTLNPLCRKGILECPDERVDLVLYRHAGGAWGESANKKIGFSYNFIPISSKISMNTPPYTSDHFAAIVEFKMVLDRGLASSIAAKDLSSDAEIPVSELTDECIDVELGRRSTSSSLSSFTDQEDGDPESISPSPSPIATTLHERKKNI